MTDATETSVVPAIERQVTIDSTMNDQERLKTGVTGARHM